MHRCSRVFAATAVAAAWFMSAARAEECYPHCDYWHYYGPVDLTYKQPGLFAYPVCDTRGNCEPYLRYVYQRGYGPRKSVTIRVPPRRVRPETPSR